MTDEDRARQVREASQRYRKKFPVWHKLLRAWTHAEQLQRGVRLAHPGNHHEAIRMLKYGTATAPEGHHLNRLCDARTCNEVYAVPNGSGVRLLCPNLEHYESGPPDGGSEVRYMRKTGRVPW